MIENETGGLTTSREGNFHLALGRDVIDISVSGNHVEVTLGALFFQDGQQCP